MQKNLTVKVTAGDIMKARQQPDKSAHNCPFVHALLRVTGKKFGVNRCGAFNKEEGYVDFPDKAIRWIDQYDGGERMSPIEFPIFVHGKV